MTLGRLVVTVSLFGFSLAGWADSDRLIIISPHRKSVQDEFIPRFIEHYQKTYKKPIQVDWLDQGGTETEMRYIAAKFEKDPKSSGVDVFWGGGDITFLELEKQGFLQAYKLPESLNAIPATVAGVPLRSPQNKWHGTALSSFGIFFNRLLLKIQKLPEPHKWEDLGKPVYLDHIIVADPRRSSTAMYMNLIMLEALGWEKGWHLLFALAGNTRSFSQSSSEPIKAVVAGDAAIAPAIDYYAASKINELGDSKLGFTLPVSETVFNSDPVGILTGAPHLLPAERFVAYLLSEEAQKIFILPKGAKDGPRYSTLARIGVNPRAYQNLNGQIPIVMNLYEYHGEQLKIAFDKLAASKRLLGDLIGALHIDTHSELKKAWTQAVKAGKAHEALAQLAAPPFSEKELPFLLEKWEDNIFRNRKINEWISYAQAKYKKKPESPKS